MDALGSAMVVTSDADSRFTLMGILSGCGLDPVAAETLNETRSVLARHPVSVVFCDEHLSDGNFRDVVREAARLPRKVPVIVSSRSLDWKHYLSILSAGAFDYFAYPPRRGEVEYLAGNALNVPVWSCRVSDAALSAAPAEHRAGS
ncbi:MAG: hypothetical protein ACRD5W_16815 [Candidatus Acidiferrales bacterium]